MPKIRRFVVSPDLTPRQYAVDHVGAMINSVEAWLHVNEELSRAWVLVLAQLHDEVVPLSGRHGKEEQIMAEVVFIVAAIRLVRGLRKRECMEQWPLLVDIRVLRIVHASTDRGLPRNFRRRCANPILK